MNIVDELGAYLKTACYISDTSNTTVQSYENAYKYCKDKGMRLYKFDSLNSYEGWVKGASSMWTTPTAPAIWVNGRRDQACSGGFYISEESSIIPMYEDVTYKSMSTCGQCMKMLNSYGFFAASPHDCSKPISFFCEFINNPADMCPCEFLLRNKIFKLFF